MQIKPAPASCYRKLRIDETDHPEARRRQAILTKVDALRARGMSLELSLLAAEVPRSTYYRWRRALRRDGVRGLVPCSRRPRGVHRPRWTWGAEQRVWALRRRYPFMGKRRLRVLLAREGLRLSESTVGRIVAKGIRRGRIQPCAFCRGRVTVKQRRRFDGHAQRWRYGQRARQPGELVQIDHLSASRESKQLKEFKAVSPVGKQLVARVYSRATAIAPSTSAPLPAWYACEATQHAPENATHQCDAPRQTMSTGRLLSHIASHSTATTASPMHAPTAKLRRYRIVRP